MGNDGVDELMYGIILSLSLRITDARLAHNVIIL